VIGPRTVRKTRVSEGEWRHRPCSPCLVKLKCGRTRHRRRRRRRAHLDWSSHRGLFRRVHVRLCLDRVRRVLGWEAARWIGRSCDQQTRLVSETPLCTAL
jgi:hypothetical protein